MNDWNTEKQHSSTETDCQAILPLRCLLEKDTTQWSYLQMFEDHCNVSTYVSKYLQYFDDYTTFKIHSSSSLYLH